MTEQRRFNLVDEPWIRVHRLDGKVEEVNLRQVFIAAHEYRSLAGEMDTQDFAVLRVLLAVLYRALDSEEADRPETQWAQWWKETTLPVDPINGYLDRWRNRLDLLDRERPFMQVADLHTAKGEWKSLELLVPDCPGPGGLFRRRDPEQPLSLAEAARWLVHCQAYDPSGIKSGAVGDSRVKGGRGYPIGIGWCGWMGGLSMEGDTLRETLLLNLVLDRGHHLRDIPVWEEPEPFMSSERTVEQRGPFGQVGLLTWQQRRIRLHAVGDEVREVLVCNGDPVPYTKLYGSELMTGWRYSEPQSKKAKGPVYMPRALQKDRALWRGLETLLPEPGAGKVDTPNGKVDAARPAEVLTWVGKLSGSKRLPIDYQVRLRAVGMEYGSNSSVITSALSDHLAFAAELAALDNRLLRAAAIAAVQRADAGVRALGNLANNLAVASGGDRGAAGTAAQARAFDALDSRYRVWLRGLKSRDDVEQKLQEWTDACRSLLIDLGEELVRGASDSAWVGRVKEDRVINVGQADRWFRKAVYEALPTEEERDEKVSEKEDRG